MLATAFYKILIVLQYETANPDQDKDTLVIRGGTEAIVWFPETIIETGRESSWIPGYLG
jgi:hypothetical protein